MKKWLLLLLGLVGITISIWVSQYNGLISDPNMLEVAETHWLTDLAINSYNKGVRDMRGEQLERATANFLAVITISKDPNLKSLAYYNLSHIALQLDKAEEAVEFYKDALRLRPDFEEAKYNLERLYVFVKKKKGDPADGEHKQAPGLADGDGEGQDGMGRHKTGDDV
jgi:tetratricopeptide (TPR) repeat protein